MHICILRNLFAYYVPYRTKPGLKNIKISHIRVYRVHFLICADIVSHMYLQLRTSDPAEPIVVELRSTEFLYEPQ